MTDRFIRVLQETIEDEQKARDKAKQILGDNFFIQGIGGLSPTKELMGISMSDLVEALIQKYYNALR